MVYCCGGSEDSVLAEDHVVLFNSIFLLDSRNGNPSHGPDNSNSINKHMKRVYVFISMLSSTCNTRRFAPLSIGHS